MQPLRFTALLAVLLTLAVSVQALHLPNNDGSASVQVLNWLSSLLQRFTNNNSGGSINKATAGVSTFSLSSSHHQTYEVDASTQRRKSARYSADRSPHLALPLSVQSAEPLSLRSIVAPIRRLRNPQAYLASRGASLHSILTASSSFSTPDAWETVEVRQPNVSDRLTLRNLARMSSLAYYAPNDTNLPNGGWDGSDNWNLSSSFGWIEDGIRGHVFADSENGTVVLALKGTSATILPGGGDTAKRDKINDNLLFSCCCAHVGWTWHTVCDCYGDSAPPPFTSSLEDSSAPALPTDLWQAVRAAAAPTCSTKCLERALVEKSLYYPAATDLYNNISYAYPNSQIWITGHSLGGALGALLGHTFGVPTVTFEAPAERMASQRLHLPLEDGKSLADVGHITHVYHSADPIPMGQCVGAASACATAGFAMEARCHTGRTLLYDTERYLGWSSSILTHRIASLIDDLFGTDWNDLVHGYNKSVEGDLGSVPESMSERRCTDCAEWKFTDDDKLSASQLPLGLSNV